MELIERNNRELALAVDRTTITTLSALKVAVITAQALGAQKNVIEQIQATNVTTNAIILGNSEMLKQNASQIASISTDPAIAVATLQKSFDNVFSAMDTVSNYRAKALESMKKTVDGL